MNNKITFFVAIKVVQAETNEPLRCLNVFSNEEKFNEWAKKNFLPKYEKLRAQENIDELELSNRDSGDERPATISEKMNIWNYCKRADEFGRKEFFYCEVVGLDEDTTMKIQIEDCGSGFPSVGDYVPGNDRNLYVIEKIQPCSPGKGNRAHADVSLVDYKDAEYADEFPALALIVADWEK